MVVSMSFECTVQRCPQQTQGCAFKKNVFCTGGSRDPGTSCMVSCCWHLHHLYLNLAGMPYIPTWQGQDPEDVRGRNPAGKKCRCVQLRCLEQEGLGLGHTCPVCTRTSADRT